VPVEPTGECKVAGERKVAGECKLAGAIQVFWATGAVVRPDCDTSWWAW